MIDSTVQPGHACVRHDEADAAHRPVQHRRRAIDDGPHRRVARADHRAARDDGAEPVREVDDVGAGDAREEVLRAAREPDDLVREDRPANHDVVVVEDQPVQRHRHVRAQQPPGELFDLRGGNRAEGGERAVEIPSVIEDVAAAGPPLDDRAADEAAQVIVGHRLVRAEGDEEIERRGPRSQRRRQRVEHERHRHGPGRIRDEHEEALAVDRRGGESVGHDPADVGLREMAAGIAVSNHH
jgi:hypothetical protein